MKHPNLPLVIVEWNDAVNWETPVSLADVSACHRPEVVYTLGWVLREDDTGISLATEYYDESYRGRSFIPHAMVKSVTRYKLSKPRSQSGSKPDNSVPPQRLEVG